MDEGDAVPDAVMKPQEDDRSTAVVLDEVDLPEGLAEVERRRHQVARGVAESPVVARPGKRDPVDVGVEGESSKLGCVIPAPPSRLR